jgi:hypothetical protein
MSAQCCCGRYKPCDEPVLHNDQKHEPLGPEGNFCGLYVDHELRDARAKIRELEGLISHIREPEEDPDLAGALVRAQATNKFASPDAVVLARHLRRAVVERRAAEAKLKDEIAHGEQTIAEREALRRELGEERERSSKRQQEVLEQGARDLLRARAAEERVEAILAEVEFRISWWPERLFPDPKPGEHGNSVLACHARSARSALREFADWIRRGAADRDEEWGLSPAPPLLALGRELEAARAQVAALESDFRGVLGRFCDHHATPGAVAPGCPECRATDSERAAELARSVVRQQAQEVNDLRRERTALQAQVRDLDARATDEHRRRVAAEERADGLLDDLTGAGYACATLKKVLAKAHRRIWRLEERLSEETYRADSNLAESDRAKRKIAEMEDDSRIARAGHEHQVRSLSQQVERISKERDAERDQVTRQAIAVIGARLDCYPEDVFPEPPPGQHGASVDACSARMARHVLRTLIDELSSDIGEPRRWADA